MAESAEKASAALTPQEIKADATLLAVDLHDKGYIMRVLAGVAACAEAFGEVKAYLLLGVQ